MSLSSSAANLERKRSKEVDKKVTDYFFKKPAEINNANIAPLSQQSLRSSQGSKPQTQGLKPATSSKPPKNNNKVAPRPDQEVISISSTESHITISSDSVQLLSTPSKPQTRDLMPSSCLNSRNKPKRTSARVSKPPFKPLQSPDIQLLGASQQSKLTPGGKRVSTPIKRKKSIFESDSDVEVIPAVVHILRQPMVLTPNKIQKTSSQSRFTTAPRAAQARHSSPIYEDSMELVPSSQSEEQELSLPRVVMKNPEEVKATVSQWQRSIGSPPSSPSLDFNLDPMDISTDLASQHFLSTSVPDAKRFSSDLSEAEVSAQLRSFSPHRSPAHPALLSTFVSPLTTPPASQPSVPLPPTPVALDTKAKTASIIEQIKAKAYAAAMSSPDEERVSLKFGELSDDDDEELDLSPFYTSERDRKSESLSATTLSKSSGGLFGRDSPAPYNLRNRRSSITSLSSLSSSQSSGSSDQEAHRTTKPVVRRGPVTTGKSKKRKSTIKILDPLDMLLNEKKLEVKRGNGADELRLAEDTLIGRDSMRSEMDDEEHSDAEGVVFKTEDWEDEEAAIKAVREGTRLSTSSCSSSPPGPGNILDEQEQKRLGLKDGTAIRKILESDKEKVKETNTASFGVPLWEGHYADDSMDVEHDVLASSLGETGGDPLLDAFKSALHHKGIAHAALFLGSGILALSNRVDALVPCLYELALSVHETPLSLPAFLSLCHLMKDSKHEFEIQFPLVLSAIICLGARTASLSAMGWTWEPKVPNEKVSKDRRIEILYRLVALMESSSHRLPRDNASDFMMVLVLIAMDPTNPVDLHCDIVGAISSICQHLGEDSDVVSETEVVICNTLGQYAVNLSPINKAYLVSLFSSGVGRAERIARWLACNSLLKKPTISVDAYTNVPGLLDLLDVLSPSPGSGSLFDIQSHNVKNDYEDLYHWISILSVALSDIDSHVDEERKTFRLGGTADNSPTKPSMERPLAPLQAVHRAIEIIYGKIVDTRAAHLDRSRAKAALQRLAMRVHYQRTSAQKSGSGTGRPRKVNDYFISYS